MRLARALAVFALATALTVGGFSYRERTRRARLDAISAAQRQLAATQLAPAGVAPRAGVSARAHIDVRPLPEKLAKQLHRDPDLHHFVHRCGVCHATPDPALHEAAEWDTVMERMTYNISAAGLLPLTEAERAAVERVLRGHALTPARAPATPSAQQPPVRR
jgi:hypothetical protein